MASGPDVLVIGGGIIGLTAAVELRRAGATVAVHDRGEFGREASWAGAGIIPPGNPDRAATPIDKLRAIGSVELPAFSDELRDRTGVDNGYRVNGGIEFLAADDRYAMDLWRAEGIVFEELPPKLLGEVEPSVAGSEASPVLLPDMAQVRNPWHLRGLIALCQGFGVELQPNHGIEGWLTTDGRVRGVRLASGETVTADRVLLAAGPWSERLLTDLGCRPGVRPVRGQILLLNTRMNRQSTRSGFEDLFPPPLGGRVREGGRLPRPVRIASGEGSSPPSLTLPPKGGGNKTQTTSAGYLGRTLIFDKRYLVPRGDGRILVGSTEEPEAGFENQTTASGLADLRAFANAVVPALADAEQEAAWAGLRPGSPDGVPFIGPVPGHENVIAAVGHHRAGVQLSLGTARFVTELILGQPTCVPPTAFALDRRPDLRARPTFRS
jgi:glycine oxidase